MSSNPTSVRVDTHPSKPLDTTDVAAFMHEARQSCVTRFEADCARAEQLLGTNDSAFASMRDELRRLLHGLVGLAGSVGYPAVSERASTLEAMLDEGHAGCPPGAAEALAAMRRALS